MMFSLLFLLKCVLLEEYEGGREEFFNFTLLGLEIWRGGEGKWRRQIRSLPIFCLPAMLEDVEVGGKWLVLVNWAQ